MALEILRDPRIRGVEWRDLCDLSTKDVAWELFVSVPWLVASLVFAYFELWFFALGSSFMFFLCGLRQVHNACHYAIGISKRSQEYLLFLLSIVMLGSMHAVQFNHLRHHKYCMSEEDVEAASARMPWWKAILWGPVFPYLLHKCVLEKGNKRIRRWVKAELAANAIWISLVLFVFHSEVLYYHLIVMLIANCLTAFFAVWTVHHDCDRSHYIARTVREKLKSRVTYSMFYHVEHHLYPRVPTCRLSVLAARLDDAAPELQKMRVF
ncbi:MAG TPA: fatty acid desaturase [Gammaproteobacteria bacterium]|nr:fatty acid desaturase [Gammaproteobacteria bacterium]